jgi:hypothetical protein
MKKLKDKNSKQLFCGALFLLILLCVPLLSEVGQNLNAVEIYANETENKHLASVGIALGAGYGVVGALGLLCVVQAVFGILAVA